MAMNGVGRRKAPLKEQLERWEWYILTQVELHPSRHTQTAQQVCPSQWHTAVLARGRALAKAALDHDLTGERSGPWCHRARTHPSVPWPKHSTFMEHELWNM